MLTEKHLEILQHAIGVDKYGQGGGYRNRFCAGGDDETLCRELVAEGLMENWDGGPTMPYYNCYVTAAGKAYIRKHSPLPPKTTRAQRRYAAFLHADSGLKFGEWLKTSWSKDVL